MKIAISTETTNDLSQGLLSKYDIKVIPFQISVASEVYKDGDLTVEELFKKVEETGVLPKTTAINEFEYTEFFEGLLKEYDAVVHICLSSGLSCSCSNAFAAANNLKNVYVVDSKSLSTGIGLSVLYAKELALKGEEPAEIQRKVQERTSAVQASFIVERLDYLYKGGRCSAMARFGANLLHIRPRIVVSEGKMGSDKKYRGPMGKVIAKYCEEVFEEFSTPDLSKVFITYTTATPEMIEAAETACKNMGFENVYKTFAGGTIASHCGANTLGILYYNDGGKN